MATDQHDILVLGDHAHTFERTDYDPTGAMAFLHSVGNSDLLRFMRRLPMVAAHQSDEPMRMSDLVYEMKLWPYVKAAYSQIEGQSGIPGRLSQLHRVYARAEAEMERETGEVRSSERSFNFATFLQIYASEGLP
ncbi:hypothetical protein [Jannaschia marina]|uniref:hypothetical protein n=1 Tax=Jannaschia marina TaxID=2741674 RepID=UPI0015CD903A|nr:hypothetical protein [Jannaschia marina]